MSGLRREVAQDLWHSCALWEHEAGWRRRLFAVGQVLLYPRIRAVVLFRLAQRAHRRVWLRPLALWLQARGLSSAGAELHPGATIGPGLNLVHSAGVVVGRYVVAGADLSLFQGVTLGDNGRDPGQPTIGDRVVIGAGAQVLGPVTIGDDARIGANAVVLRDVPAGAVATGVPAHRPLGAVSAPGRVRDRRPRAL